MQELNHFQSLQVLEEDSFDTLTLTNMGDGIIALAQTDADGQLHNVILGPQQGQALRKMLEALADA